MAIKRTGNNNGPIFPEKQFLNAHAILIEVKRDAPQDPGGYNGKTTDAFYADYTIFQTEADLKAGVPTKVLRNARCDKKGLRSHALNEKFLGVGETGVRSLEMWQGPNAEGPSYSFRFVPGSIIDEVEEWLEKQEAALAEAATADDTPAFLK